ncbi:unknown [Clostridium sp. CAG:306]|nr:hypothetical protein [Clostridium sp.]CDC20988.1 unknown [Clostridium sp. CAG:306]
MSFLKKIFNKLKDIFCIPQAPVGLQAMGIRAKYLNKVNGFNYSANRFYTDLMSPVKDPYLLNLNDL